MREHGGEQRVVFIAPRRMSSLARDAAHSAGAVAWLEKPVSAEALEVAWSSILGPVPEAPGLEDLDSLYPGDRVKPEADLGPILPLPDLPLPLPVTLPVPALAAPLAPMNTKRRRTPLLLLVLAVGAAAAAYAIGALPF